MKARHLLMAIGLAVAAWFAIFGDKTPSGDITEAVSHIEKGRGEATVIERTASKNSSDDTKHVRDASILALQDRDILIGRGHRQYSNGMFGSHDWTPPPPPPPAPLPPPPPSAPSLPFTYIGKKWEAKKWEVYVTRGEQTFIAKEGAVIDNTYRVDSIKPPTMSLTYLPLQQEQTLSIGGDD